MSGESELVRVQQELGLGNDVLLSPDMDATVEYGAVRPGHGVKVKLNVDMASLAKHERVRTLSGTLDVHGDLWRAFPAGLGSLAQMMLPLHVRMDPSSDGKVQFVLGAKKIEPHKVMLDSRQHRLRR